MIPKEEETYLGFDLSTQKLKGVQLNSKLQVLVHAEVKFDIDLPEFRTSGGVNLGNKQDEYYVQPVMWVKALDMVLDRLVVYGANLNTVTAISGSAQQHGSCFWSKHGVDTLKDLDADKFLHVQINDSAFAVSHSPIWMDGTTEIQCKEMEESVGGRNEMVQTTGSKCYPRFTGPQIRKVYQTKPNCYENTVRISLVSSFLASIFLGDIAPIDYSDASGMNLFDINEKNWSKSCLVGCAPDLEEKLGKPVRTCSIIGNIGTFFVQRYGFDPNCKVTAFTGDNSSALTGMMIGKDWLAISLGTSDTVMMGLSEPANLEEGHVLCHPVGNNYMGLLCFRNGSLVRDIFRKIYSNNNWDNFSELLVQTPRGNFGNIALHLHTMEIIPPVKGTLRWNKTNTTEGIGASAGVLKFGPPQIEIRALIEGQMLHRKAVAADMGFSFGESTKILATGGASVNIAILQVMSDVFNAPVYIQKTSEAALLGAAYRAKYTMYLHSMANNESNAETFDEYVGKYLPHNLQRVCDPHSDSSEIYNPMLDRYSEMVTVLKSLSN